jgi:hypothetical protein
MSKGTSGKEALPHLEQRFVELNDLLLEDLRPSLLCKGRGLHDAWQQTVSSGVSRRPGAQEIKCTGSDNIT